ncbi:MAG: outer rane chaperone Skp (OmpH) [Edaphobacter sp.]|nr:outer rane chaperone Skp (OmpH) [Edaphobacter sp.]
MNRNVALASALAAALTTAAGMAQTSGPQAPAASAPAPASAPVAPQAIPAKIAIIEYEQVAASTNEGQRSLQELQKKYEPKKTQLEALGAEIDSLQKQLQASGSTLSETDHASRLRAIDTKQKQYQRDGEDATNAFNSDMQEALGKVAQKLGPTVVQYVEKNGYTMLFDNTGQQGGMTLMWSVPGTDISQAVIDAYNASSGVAAPPPSAPSATRPRATTPAPRPAAPAPRPVAPKQ